MTPAPVAVLPGDHFRLICDAAIMLGHLDREDADRQIFDMQTANISAYLKTRHPEGGSVALPVYAYEPVTPIGDDRLHTFDMWLFAVDWFVLHAARGYEWVDNPLRKWAWQLYDAIDQHCERMTGQPGGRPGLREPMTAGALAAAATVQPFRRENVRECVA